MRVVDRTVMVIPGDGPGWVQQLHLLADQLTQGPKVIADGDLDALADAIDTVNATMAKRSKWRGRFDSWV